eukprot:s127_g35.t1
MQGQRLRMRPEPAWGASSQRIPAPCHQPLCRKRAPVTGAPSDLRARSSKFQGVRSLALEVASLGGENRDHRWADQRHHKIRLLQRHGAAHGVRAEDEGVGRLVEQEERVFTILSSHPRCQRAAALFETRSAMRLHELSDVLLVHVLDLSLDTTVLELSAASHALKNGVDRCRRMSSEGPWQHLPGAWQTSGLWRYLGFGDLQRIPEVTLCCEVKFQGLTEVLAFFKAVKALAADTIDGHVTFKKLMFDDAVKTLFSKRGIFSTDETTVVFDGYQMECFLDAFFYQEDDEVPLISLCVTYKNDKGLRLRAQDFPQIRPFICCSSVLLPKLRLLAGYDIYGGHDLDAESPLTDLVRANLPLPMLFGVKGHHTYCDSGSLVEA